ncbi:hypothetical protein PsYK624_011750 [Phanerochaete sordida]|uniref:Uncharacterized protein n=1 Tax=Phanerochaete sordida TaxID=48140 RepID=A0A9P3FXQ2_9APHY|nr:hypothetical protein PsYK624_011750 [Phanerochaete sordida]
MVDQHSTVLAMGLACKAFYKPAMKALWRELGSPEPLIRVLPEHTRGDQLELQLTVVDKPSSEDWKRFMYYAQLVRALHYMRLECLDDDDDDDEDSDDSDDSYGHKDGDHGDPQIAWDSFLKYF